MKNTFRQAVLGRITRHVARNRVLYILISASLLVGAAIGAVSANFLDSGQTAQLIDYMGNFFSAYGLSSIDNTQVFLAAVYNNAKLILLVWAFGIFIVGIPLVMFEVGARGFKIGFSVAFLVRAYGVKGLLFSAGSILPSGIIFIPLLIAYAVTSGNFGANLHYLRKNRIDTFQNKKTLFTRSIISLLCVLALAAACGGIDAWVVPIIVRPISGMAG